MALQLQPMAFPSCHSVVPPSKRLISSSKVFMTSSTHSLAAVEVEKKKTYRYHPAKEVVEFRATHSMPAEKMEIFKSLETWMADDVLSHLKEVEKNWQPHDFLPTSEVKEGFLEEVKELRESCKEIPDEYFLLVAVSMVTEEALPTYLTALNTLDGTRDETGVCLSPWAIWARAWTAEENRHGDLLNKYLYLSGRVDMRQIEKSIQYLIGAGMDTKWENNPYKGFIYTTFQERATAMFHGRTGGLVKAHGDIKLAQICGTIAADEKRHEAAYTKIVEKLFQIDPDETMLALEDMMRKNITMPTQFVYDGMDDNLFRHVSAVAQRLGVYTAKDYADNMEFLIRRWKVDKLTGLSGDAQRAQEYVCELPPKIRKLEERAQQKAMRGFSTVPFSWIFGKQVRVL